MGVFADVRYRELEGFRPLYLDLHVPSGVTDPPLVVWIHGGGFRWGDRRDLPETLTPGAIWDAVTEAGMACATVDYRLTGEAIFPAQLEDVIAAIDHLVARAREFGIDAGRLGVWGESAGGHLAAMAALTDRRVSAALPWYPLTDVTARDPHGHGTSEEMLLGARPCDAPEAATAASPVSHVTSSAPPFLFVHGGSDATVPPAQSERLHELLLGAGVTSRVRIVPGADHCFEGYDDVPGLIGESVAFFKEHLT